MTAFNEYRFKYPWRKYQAKVLGELATHLTDGKLNVVAAPGAGKTVLGLETICRLNKSVLILAPTITIKNQWVDRFVELFMEVDSVPDFISTDIYNLKQFNVATYQALHYAHKRKRIVEGLAAEEENEKEARAVTFEYDLVGEMKAQQIEVIVLDESHHLRSAWWKSLTEVMRALAKTTTVTLTATPPYDADKNEWNKYTELCGIIDCEITVPELVATGDLCAHQDFIIFNKLTAEEEKQTALIKEGIVGFIHDLKANTDLLQALALRPELNDFSTYQEQILENPRYYSSLLVFLHATKTELNKEIVEALGGGAPIPALSYEWLEIMLQGLLNDDKEFQLVHKGMVQAIHSQLSKIGAIVNGHVTLQDNNEIRRIMAGSIGKIGSIAEIAINEHATLGADLSMVILTDYVRSQALSDEKYQKIGVIPIFKRIVKDIGITPNDDKVVARKIPYIAVLSGKIKIIPKTLINLIEEKIPCEFQEIGVEGYVAIKTTDKNANKLVGIITELMNEKKINIIIGTVALLGEGWDCQAINSLILASFVGSYMLSNQMRGRAIRTDKTKDKVANIWHLVSLTKDSYENQQILANNIDLGDYLILKRRFKSFLGIAYSTNTIENGIQRIDILNDVNLSEDYEEINKQMYRLSRTRQNTRKRWQEILALYGGEDIQIVQTLRSDFQQEKRFKSINVTEMRKASLLAVPTLLGGGIITTALLNWPSYYFLIGGGLLAGFSIGQLLRSGYRIFGHFQPAKDMEKIAGIVLTCLKNLGYLNSEKATISIKTKKLSGIKSYEAELSNATVYENNVFIQCVREIYERVDNPRYLIAHGGKKSLTKVYFSVPSLFSVNKEKAEQFYKLWQKRFGKSELIYTRTVNGRKTLLKARKGSFDYDDKMSQHQHAIKNRRWK